MVRVLPRPFQDLFETQFPHKTHFPSYLNLKATPNFVHVQSQVYRLYYDADSPHYFSISVRSQKRSRLQHCCVLGSRVFWGTPHVC